MLTTVENFWFGKTNRDNYYWLKICFCLASITYWFFIFPERHSILGIHGFIDESNLKFPSDQIFSKASTIDLFFILGAIANLFLLLGVIPRLSCLVVSIFNLLIVYRLGELAAGVDQLIKVSSLLIIFCPIASMRDLDRYFFNKKPLSNKAPQHGLKLFQLQLLIIYTQTFVYRIDNNYWWNGDFLAFYILSIHSWLTPYIAYFPELLLKGFSYCALFLEPVVPILLFFKSTKIFGLILGLSIHLFVTILSPQLFLFIPMLAPFYATFLKTRTN